MSDPTTFKSFEEFWPFYVRQHSRKGTRILHFTGTALALGLAAYAAVKRKPKTFLLAPVVGYGFAWVGHFFVEKNMPATFKNPLWSFRGDMRMFSMMLAGTMDEEVRRVLEADQDEHAEPTRATASSSSDEAPGTTAPAGDGRPASTSDELN